MSILKKRRRRKKIKLYLVDDSVNSFQYVIEVLSNTLPECSVIRAEQMATMTHHTGECHIHTGKSPDVYYVQTMLVKQGLNVISKKYGKDLFN